MKNKLYIFILLFLVLGCSSDDDSCVGIDCLPEATQTGAGTFGCLVNGEPFVDNSGNFNCFYQLVDGEYYFGITARVNRDDYIRISIGSLGSAIQENTTVELKEREDGNFYALLSFDCICPRGRTSSDLPGNLTITKFGTNPNIVSAEFDFTVTDPNTGKVYEITEGRFDAQFNR